MSPREGPSRPKFGRIDPYCLMAVLPVLLVAGILGALVNVLLGVGCAVFAALILLFDSWANRPLPRPVSEPRPRPAAARARPPARPRPPAVRERERAQPAPWAQGPDRAQGPARAPARRTAPPPPRPQAPRMRQAPRSAPYG
ncbi:hypothetical protein SAMN04489730_4739 [Amycolatopsis australiensis]|uniref:Uncharacterized protein n=1 Tax=Amycolatopsis australiensis TaxID=546364 RepID=A0A1K1S4T4_9PSEU|nr:hypothetical protein SAMN04489730_4739 [Amycolatopsis australiensis]